MSEYDPCVKKNPPRPTNLPEGWELTREYRPPLAGEYFLNVSSSPNSVGNAIANFVNPCWILQRKKDKSTITKTYTKPTAEDWGFVILPIIEPILRIKSWDKMYMDIAIRVASESKCPRKKVGCAILLDSGLIATGLNGFPAGQEELWMGASAPNPLVTHAELNAMGKLLEEGVSCKDATVYTTLSPCVDCSKLLVRAKVKRVVYLEEYRCTAGIDYLRKYGVRVEKI